jgi:hypothetical protein
MPDEILWPLRAVSKDPTNLTKLDADNNVLTSTTDVDARYVRKVGDTMTGNLFLERDGAAGANAVNVNVYTDTNTNAVINFRKTRGTKAAQTPLLVNDTVGRLNFNTINSAGANASAGVIQFYVTQVATANGVGSGLQFVVTELRPADGALVNHTALLDQTGTFVTEFSRTGSLRTNAIDGGGVAVSFNGPVSVRPSASPAADQRGLQVNMAGTAKSSVGCDIENIGGGTDINAGVRVFSLPAGPVNWGFFADTDAKNYFRGNVGINLLAPTHHLEVGGDAMIRGPLEVTGNITTAGTAHSFAAGSIGSPAVIGNTPRTIAATGSAGSAGQMVWDDNFIYLRTTSGWKKVALTAL